ncbi:hypothetical protein HOY80DRAFT_307736 [Tuber brumale]|nr:hypothetical protein HOY80DRAFT_307736 [Tuber brumale]
MTTVGWARNLVVVKKYGKCDPREPFEAWFVKRARLVVPSFPQRSASLVFNIIIIIVIIIIICRHQKLPVLVLVRIIQSIIIITGIPYSTKLTYRQCDVSPES